MTENINTNRLKNLFRDMVNIYSPSGKEKLVTDYLTAYLHENGLPVTNRPVTEGRFNVEVTLSPDPPDLAFIGHIDTIPAFDIENYEFLEKNGQIAGLGTADMKGGCAAMIEAFICAHHENKLPTNTALYLVVGEEESGDGTEALLRSDSFPCAVVAEPTNLCPCFAHFGYIEMLITAFGTRRHASLANRQYNAIYNTLETILQIGQLLEKQHPRTVMNIRSLHSSESGFAVPSSCQAWLDLHIKPDENIENFTKILKNLADQYLSGTAVTKYDIQFPFTAPGYQLDTESRFAQTLKQAFKNASLPFTLSTFQSHSDANLLRQAGTQPVILGPGSLARAHTADESIDFQQVIAAAELYKHLLLLI